MKILKSTIIILLIQCSTLNYYSQLPAVQVNEARFTKEVWGGVIMHSQGFGLNLNYSKFKTYKKKKYLKCISLHEFLYSVNIGVNLSLFCT